MSASRPALRTLIAVMGLAVTFTARGQSDFFEQEKDYFLSRTIEGASKHTEALSETPATATIITREDIERYGFKTVAEVLSFAVPGYTAATDRTWDFAGGRGLTFFEDFNTRILVMLDGHPMNEPWNNFSGIGREMLVPLDLVERIEVIQGPSSLLYGGYSLYGMINVVTSDGQSLTGTRARVSLGTADSGETVMSFGASGVTPGKDPEAAGTPWSFFAAGGYYRSHGESLEFPRIDVFSPVDFQGGTIWGGRQTGTDFERAPFGLLKASRGPLSLLVRTGYRDRGEVFAKFGAIYGSPYEVRRDSKTFLELRYRPKLGEHLEGSFRAFGDSYRYFSQSTFSGLEYYRNQKAFFYVLKADTWDAGGEASFTYRRGVHLLTFGAEYRIRRVEDSYGDLRFDSLQPLAPVVERASSGHLLVVYLQEEWRPTRTLSFVAGATFADTEPGGDTILPRLAVIWKPSPRLSVKALYGLGFRPPSLYEAENEAENATLRPEEMRSTELSVLWDIGSGATLQGYAFDSRLSGLIRYHARATGSGYQALDDVPARGAGVGFQGRTGKLRGYLNLAYAKARLERPETPDQELPGSSMWLASGGVSCDVGAFTGSVFARYLGKQSLDPAFFETGSAGDFVETNARLQWKTRVAFYPVTVSLDLRNLFDVQGKLAASPSQVLSYVPIPGRSAVVGFEVRF